MEEKETQEIKDLEVLLAPGVKTETPVASDSEECKVLMVWTACLGLMERPGHKESVESLVIPENEDPSHTSVTTENKVKMENSEASARKVNVEDLDYQGIQDDRAEEVPRDLKEKGGRTISFRVILDPPEIQEYSDFLERKVSKVPMVGTLLVLQGRKDRKDQPRSVSDLKEKWESGE